MSTSIFVNLTTSDLPRAKSFYQALGWQLNENFSDENAASIAIDENIYLMVLTREYFSTFTPKTIPDPHNHAQMQTALSVDSRGAVDAFLDKVLAAGGTEPKAAQDYGFMYARDFEDPDGNEFSILWMDPKAAEMGPEAFMAEQSDPTEQG